MFWNKNAISPVVATALLLVVSVISVVGFQIWFTSYSSSNLNKVEIVSSSATSSSNIEQISGRILYFKNSKNTQLTIISVIIDGVNCKISGKFTGNILGFEISACISNITSSNPEIILRTPTEIYTKKVYLDINNLNLGEYLPIIYGNLFAKGYALGSQTNDHLGYDVGVSGDYSIVSADFKAVGGITKSGVAYIYERDGLGNWNEKQILSASDKQTADYFGRSVSISGSYAVVGAPNEDTGGINAGAAYIFERNLSGSWVEKQILHASDMQAGDQFGDDVSIFGNYLVVGAKFEATGGAGAGAAYIFERNLSGSWVEKQILYASDAQASDQFAYSVGIYNNYLVVGAKFEDTGGSNAGAAYVYERDGLGSWNEVSILHASDAQASDFFGNAVGIFSNYAVVGAFGEDTGAFGAGAAYIFSRNLSGSWVEKQILHASDAQWNDQFAYSLSLGQRHLVVGAYLEDGGIGDPTTSSGAAYIFERDNVGVYTETKILRANDGQAQDKYGFSVEINNNDIFIGSEFGDGPGGVPVDSGSFYTYK